MDKTQSREAVIGSGTLSNSGFLSNFIHIENSTTSRAHSTQGDDSRLETENNLGGAEALAVALSGTLPSQARSRLEFNRPTSLLFLRFRGELATDAHLSPLVPHPILLTSPLSRLGQTGVAALNHRDPPIRVGTVIPGDCSKAVGSSVELGLKPLDQRFVTDVDWHPLVQTLRLNVE